MRVEGSDGSPPAISKLQNQLNGAGMDVKVGIDVPSQPRAGLLENIEPKRVRSMLG